MNLFGTEHGPYLPLEVGTGEVYCTGADEVLTVSALGSCVAVVAVDPVRRVGGIAHIMLPGKAPSKVMEEARCRYAEDALERLATELGELGAIPEDVRVVLVGAGNVLQREDDSICISNIQAVREVECRWHLRIVSECMGGFETKRVRLDMVRGLVLCAVGDGQETVSWSFGSLTDITNRFLPDTRGDRSV